MALQTRDKILKEGVIRYRQSTISLQKWRSRHVVFKVTHAGRLQLIVHKESPPTAANEIKEVAIDEFGGLDYNLKIDNEKYAFAIITTHITECFSTDSPHELTEWIQLLQEYLGKELVININIPVKQHLLKTGKATLRIRNTGFTITTCDNPPRCQGTWHIIHIRKYGGSELFRFQTGSKCPTGEYLYSIETKDNAGIKKLFNDLSNHKPIFTDDRLGRRMTLERSFHRNAVGKPNAISRTGNTRLSLQTSDRNGNSHLYENHDPVTKQASHNLSVPHSGIRRASVDNGVLRSDIPGGRQGMPIRKILSGEDSDLQYQNVQQGKSSQQDRASPTKKLHLTAINVPVPDGYYNLTPPSLVRRHHSSNTSPPSSPEENVIREQALMRSIMRSPESYDHSTYENFSSDGSGFTGVTRKTSVQHQLPKQIAEESELDGVYQNLDFMKGSSDSRRGVHVPEPLDIDEVAPSVPTTITEEEPWSPHNYSNVQQAQANIHGQIRKDSDVKVPTMSQSSVDNAKAMPQRMDNKVNKPTTMFSFRDSPVRSIKTQPLTSTSSDNLLSPLPTNPISSSNSNGELNKASDYYNHFANKLPANSGNHSGTLGIRNRFVLSTDRQSMQSDTTSSDHDSTEILSPDGDYSQIAVIDDSKYQATDDMNINSKVQGYKGKLHRRSSSCDCLDMSGPADSDNILVDNRPDSYNAIYDKLAPSIDADNDSPQPNREERGSQYNKKTPYQRQEHKYEYVDWDLEHKRSSNSRSTSPENPLEWTNSLPINLDIRKTSSQSHPKVTNTLSRRKNLPLQEPGESESLAAEQKFSRSEYNTTSTKARPPKLSRGQSVDSTDYHAKPSRSKLNRFSPDSSDRLSSTDSISGTKQESSGELNGDQEIPTSTSSRITHEEVDIKNKHKQNTVTSTVLEQPPPIPKRGQKETSSSKSSPEETDSAAKSLESSPPIPPRLKEGRFTVQLPPQGEIDIIKPPRLPKPRFIATTDTSYTPVTIVHEEKQVYSLIEPFFSNSRPSLKVAPTSENVSYVAVDFDMTLGLERTSEQVKIRLGEYLNGDQQS